MPCLKKMPGIVDKSHILNICVDDFAIRKRFSYGTIMVDLDTHRIIDLLPSRETQAVQEWLKTYPNIRMVSRDGAMTYSSAASQAHPEAIQISDRFHLIKTLSEAVQKYIIREFPSRVEIPAGKEISEEMRALYDTSNRAQRIRFAHQKREEGFTINEISLLLHSSPTTITKYLKLRPDEVPEDKKIVREREHQQAIEKKQRDVDEARKLYESGITVEKIAVLLQHSKDTIKRYLNQNYNAVNGHYDNRRTGKLAPYEQTVIDLRCQGYTYQSIYDMITAKGYTGSLASLRMFMQKERKHAQTQGATGFGTVDFVQRKSLCQIIYKKLEEIPVFSQEQYEEIVKKYPVLGQLYAALKEFHEIMFSKKPERLGKWLEKMEKMEIPEISSFVEGTKKDIIAAENSITYEYNNGLAEGSVNKVKVIKRIMYGRNSFELLKAKVLLREKFYHQIN